jgi:haloalkane dehalogenase
MKALRTPDERFQNLSNYPFAPNYLYVPDGEGGRLRVHYLDEGPHGTDTIILMHGEPSWSYLYRKMVPIIVAEGFRTIVPDLIGFGRSDKPANRGDYTYQRHVDWMRALLDQMNLINITLVCQDWGGLIGLRLLSDSPGRFSRVVTANTGLPTGDQKMPDAFLEWRKFSQETPEFPVSTIVTAGCVKPLSPEVKAAYDAPFPDETYKEGARIFPSLVPASPDDPAAPANRKAWETLKTFDKPFLTAFSDSDPITQGGEHVFQRLIPGAQGQPHVVIKGGGHFIQEDCGEEFAQVVVDFIRTTGS